MSTNGSMIHENVHTSQVKEKKKSRALQTTTSKDRLLQQESRLQSNPGEEELDLVDDLRDFDSDSGVSSLRHSRSKLATSISGTNIGLDDESDDEDRPKTGSFVTEPDDQDRRESDTTSLTNFTINKTSDDFQMSSRTNSLASSGRAGTLSPSSSNAHQLSAASASAQANASNSKEKTGVRKLIRKIFRSSPSTSKQSSNTRSAPLDPPKNPELNIDLANGTAYPIKKSAPVTQGPIRLLVLRHGERLDRYYSSQWLRQAFDKDGNYCRFSPILPETLPLRASIRDFDLDPPLTYKGLKDAYHTGTVLRDKSIQISYCYSSPSLRCVQTAAKILEGLQLQNKLKIRLEPGLFECTGWYVASESNNALIMPKFLTKKEFLENKYAVDKHYREHITYADVSRAETELEFYQRSHAVTTSILKMHETDYITQIQQGQCSPQQNLHVLFIAHAPSLETCTRKLCGGKFRPDTLAHVIRNVDYLTMTVIEKTDNNSDKWIFRRSSFYGDEF